MVPEGFETMMHACCFTLSKETTCHWLGSIFLRKILVADFKSSIAIIVAWLSVVVEEQAWFLFMSLMH